MIHRVFSPNPGVAHLVDHYWYTQINHNATIEHRYTTPLLEGLAFNFDRLTQYHNFDDNVYRLDKKVYVLGQAVSPRMAQTSPSGLNLFGVKLHPLAIARLTGIDMEQIANKIIPAEDIWGHEIEWLCDEMQSVGSIENAILVLERFLIAKFLQAKKQHRIHTIESAIGLVVAHSGTLSVKDLQHQTNTSRKTLERAFKQYLGITPKLYSAIVRYNQAKALIENTPQLSVGDVSYRMGYHDNSHFASEFKRFSNYTPSEYAKMARAD